MVVRNNRYIIYDTILLANNTSPIVVNNKLTMGGVI